MQDILQAIKEDDEYTALLKAIHHNDWKNSDLHPYTNVRNMLDSRVERSVYYAVKGDRIVVPRAVRGRILQLCLMLVQKDVGTKSIPQLCASFSSK